MKMTEQVTMIVADLVARLEQEFKIIILPGELIHEHYASIATSIRFIGHRLAEAS